MNESKLRRLIVAHSTRAAQLRAMTDQLRAAREDIRRETASVWSSGRDSRAIEGVDPVELMGWPKDRIDALSFDVAGCRRVVAMRENAAELQRQVDALAAAQQASGTLVRNLEIYARDRGVQL